MADEIVCSHKMENLLNYNKLKLYTYLLRVEMNNRYGDGLRMRGVVDKIDDIPEDATPNDLYIVESDVQFKNRVSMAGNLYRRTEDGVVALFEENNYYDYEYSVSSETPARNVFLKCKAPVVLLVSTDNYNATWSDILFFYPSTKDNSSILHSLTRKEFSAFGSTYQYKSLGIAGLSYKLPYYNPVYKFKVLSYYGDPGTLEWVDEQTTDFEWPCKPLIKNDDIIFINPGTVIVDSEGVSSSVNTNLYKNFQVKITDRTKPVNLMMAEGVEDGIYNFSFNEDTSTISFVSEGLRKLTISERISVGDIVVLRVDNGEYRYNVVKPDIISSDGSVNISRINGVTDLSVSGIEPVKVPTKTSELENDSHFITGADIPSIPTKTSELENDSHFVKESDLPKLELRRVVEIDSSESNPFIMMTLDTDKADHPRDWKPKPCSIMLDGTSDYVFMFKNGFRNDYWITHIMPTEGVNLVNGQRMTLIGDFNIGPAKPGDQISTLGEDYRLLNGSSYIDSYRTDKDYYDYMFEYDRGEEPRRNSVELMYYNKKWYYL